MEDLKSLTKIFKALSNPHRLELYLKIKSHHEIDLDRKKKRTCLLSSLCENWCVGAPTISHHLKELVNAGLVESGKTGKFTTCSLNSKTLTEILKLFEDSK